MATYSKFVADIGGTHARFALVDDERKERRASLVEVKVFNCADFPNAAATVIAYQNYIGGELPPMACIAAAGPVSNGEVRFTNLSWHLSTTELQETLHLKELEILNDFTAVAYSIADLTPEELRPLYAPPVAPITADGVSVIIGAGTGLGVAALIKTEDRQSIVQSEGGHARFAPADTVESELLNYLRHEHEHVSMEMLLSGPGIRLLHRALGVIYSSPVDHALSSEDITSRAVGGIDKHCVQTVRLYSRILASFCSDLVATFHARSGVYLVGQVFRSIEPFLQTESFRQRYVAAGPMSALMMDTPVNLVLVEYPGLQGAAARARTF